MSNILDWRVPSRADRASILDAVGGIEDDPRVLQAVREVAQMKNWKPTLKDFAANETFSNMLDSILRQRIGLALVSPEELKAQGLSDDLSAYGYMFDPEQAIWTSATMDDAKAKNLPWYKTSKDAIHALYEDALRDDNGKLIGNFDMNDLYAEMNNRLQGMVDSMIAEDPSIVQKLAENNVIHRETGRDENGVLDIKNLINPYEENGFGHTLASSVAPMRTWNLLAHDPELASRASNSDIAKAVIGDAVEGGLTLFNPLGGKLAGLAAKGLSKIPLKAVAPRLARWGGDKGYAWLQNVGENSLGNMANAGISQAVDYTDTDNTWQSQGFDPKDIVAAGAVAGAFPALAGMSRGLSDKLIKGKPKLRQMMADSYNSRPMAGRISTWDVKPSEVKELMKSPSYFDFVNKPYIDRQKAGFTHYATPKINSFVKRPDMSAADADDALLARVIKATGDEKASREWFRTNFGDREALKNNGDLMIGHTDESSKPFFTESAERFMTTQGTHPVASYKTQFAMPITQYEESNPGIIEKLTPKQRAQRYTAHRADNLDRTRRERLIEQFAPKKDNWGSDPTGRTNAKGLDLRAQNKKTRIAGMVAPRIVGVETIPELFPDSPYNVIRNGVPLRHKQEEE